MAAIRSTGVLHLLHGFPDIDNHPHVRTLAAGLGWLIGGAGALLAGRAGGAASFVLLLLGRIGLVRLVKLKDSSVEEEEEVPEVHSTRSQEPVLDHERRAQWLTDEVAVLRKRNAALEAELARLKQSGPSGLMQGRMPSTHGTDRPESTGGNEALGLQEMGSDDSSDGDSEESGAEPSEATPPSPNRRQLAAGQQPTPFALNGHLNASVAIPPELHAVAGPRSPKSPRRSPRFGPVRFSEKVLAAEADTAKSSSELSVQVDNTADEGCTVVRVTAPNLARLLADFAGAISGLGLSIVRAQIATVGSTATNSFFIQEVVYPGGGRKVWGKERLNAIEQRLRQLFVRRMQPAAPTGMQLPPNSPARSRYDGNGVLPLWARAHELESSPLRWAGAKQQQEDDDESLFLAGLTAAFSTGWGVSKARIAPASARRLAADVLPRLARVVLPAGASATNEKDGEWLLLLEESASVLVEHEGGERSPRSSRTSGGPLPSTDTVAAAAEHAPGIVHEHSCVASFPRGSVLWASAHAPPALQPPPQPHSPEAGRLSGSSATSVDGAVAAAVAPRWYSLRAPTHSSGPLRMRVIHQKTLRMLLVGLRESLGQEHASQLAELPLFAPLSPPELLSLCRRATEVIVSPRAPIEANASSRGEPLSAGTLPPDAFAVVLRGEVLLSLAAAADDDGDGAASSNAAAVELAASTMSDALRPTSPLPAPPPSLVLSRLRQGSTLGETGSLLGSPTVCAHAAAGGAVLLCWRREAQVEEVLARLPALIEQSWHARTPLALLARTPALARLILPRRLSEVHRLLPQPSGEERAVLCIALEGEMREGGDVTVEIKRIRAPGGQTEQKGQTEHTDGDEDERVLTRRSSRTNLATLAAATASAEQEGEGEPVPTVAAEEGSSAAEAGTTARAKAADQQEEETPFPLYELMVSLPSRNRLLAELTATLSSLGLDVLDGDIVAGPDGRAHDRLRVRDISSAPRSPGVELAARVRGKLQEALEATSLGPGDAIVLERGTTLKSSSASAGGAGPAADATEDDDPLVGCMDLHAFGLALALCEGSTGGMWRRFLHCLAPSLVAESLLAESLRRADWRWWRRRARRAAESRQRLVSGRAEAWQSALVAFSLHALREAMGHAEDGLQLAQLVLGPEAGKGASSTVQLARDELSGRLYAVKRFKKAHLGGADGLTLLRNLERERDVLRLMATAERGDIHHGRWVIHVVCSGQTAHELRLVMPACLGGDMQQLLERLGQMGDEPLRFYAACLVLALCRLHSHGIVYRDLKPENVLLHADGWPVLADAGLAAFAQDERPLFSLCGTPEYMAPEVVAQSRGYGAAADWWSLGVLLSQCLTLTTPFLDHNVAVQTLVNIFMDRRTAPASLNYRHIGSKPAVALIDALLDRDTGRRLRGEGLQLHPFFWGLDWAALQRRDIASPHAQYAGERAREAESAFAQWELERESEARVDGEPPASPSARERRSEMAPAGWERVPGW